MKHSALALLLIVSLSSFAGCWWNVVNNPTPPGPPAITGFSRDTVWTGDSVTIYGKNLQGDDFTIGSVSAYWEAGTDSSTAIGIPQNASTDYVYASNSAGKAKSLKQLTILQSLSVYRVMPDSAPSGAWVTIYGSGFVTRKDSLILLLNGVAVPIDSFFADSIKFRVPANGSTGELVLVYRDSGFVATQTFFVTRPLRWGHITLIANGWNVVESHYRNGFTNYHHWQLDSTWEDTVTLNWQTTSTIPAGAFYRTPTGLALSTYLPRVIPDGVSPYLDLTWDTIQNKFSASLGLGGYATGLVPVTFTRDTFINLSPVANPTTSADEPMELDIPYNTVRPYLSIIDNEAANTGEYDWRDGIDVIGNFGNPGNSNLIIRFDP